MRRVFLATTAFTLFASLLTCRAEAVQQWHICAPVSSGVYSGRIDVECNAATSTGIKYFALQTPGGNDPVAARMLTVIQTALAGNRSIAVRFDDADLSGAAWGCQTNDCRPLLAVRGF